MSFNSLRNCAEVSMNTCSNKKKNQSLPEKSKKNERMYFNEYNSMYLTKYNLKTKHNRTFVEILKKKRLQIL